MLNLSEKIKTDLKGSSYTIYPFVIIDDSNHPYDGLAEWTIEVTWGTTWAEDPGS